VGTRTLKDQNWPAVAAVLGLNIGILALFLQAGHLDAQNMSDLLRWRLGVPTGLAVAVTGLVMGLMSSNAKARLVFWRWTHPLPGSFAFSRYVGRDPRIDQHALRAKVRPWPADPKQQNTLWYRFYKSVEREPAALDAHRYFLMARECTAIAALMVPLGAFLSVWHLGWAGEAGWYVAALIAQYLLARHAASTYGLRLVTTVLALTAQRP
jgi:hypothetical protein